MKDQETPGLRSPVALAFCCLMLGLAALLGSACSATTDGAEGSDGFASADTPSEAMMPDDGLDPGDVAPAEADLDDALTPETETIEVFEVLPPEVVELPGCPTFAPGVEAGALGDERVLEASGLAASHGQAGVLWTHNDSGGAAEVYALGLDGRSLGAFQLEGGYADDWEDMAADAEHLYLGDIGDNAESRPWIAIYRVLEPEVDALGPATDGLIAEADITVLRLRYPDRAHNAETLMIDSATGDLYVVTKEGLGPELVFRAAAPLDEVAPIVLEPVTELNFGTSVLPGNKLATGGDIHPSGDAILLLSYTNAYWWWRLPDETVVEAFARPACPVPLAGHAMHEAIAFLPEHGGGYLSLPEGLNAPLFRYDPL